MIYTEKSLTVSILKVYNWNEVNSSDDYQFSFYSSQSQSLILQKKIKTQSSNNQLIINTSLKITYTSEEAQIIIKMAKINEDSSITAVDEFMIDLDLLKEKRTQFLPFSKNDKILQVQCGTAQRQQRQERRQKRPMMGNNQLDDFILEKEVYLRNISAQSRSRYGGYSARESFTEKLYALLQETKHLRLKIQSQRNGEKDREVREIQYKISPVNQVETGKQRLLIKSYSEDTLNAPKNVKKAEGNFVAFNRKIGTTRKCKLDLRNLTVIKLQDGRSPNADIPQDSDEVLRSQQQFPLHT